MKVTVGVNRLTVLATVGLLVACGPQAQQDKAGASGLPVAASGTPLGLPHSGLDPHRDLDPNKLIQVALQHRAEGREAEAAAVLDAAIAKYPQNAELIGMRGALALEQGESAVALKNLEAAAKLDSANVSILTNRAQAYRRFKRIDEAMRDLDRAIELKPDFVPARFNRGAILFTRGNYRAALADFDRCIAIEPHVSAPYFNRALAHESLGERPAAIADLERFMRIADNEEGKRIASELLAKWKSPPKSKGADAVSKKPG